jgi:hypothetical protein
MRARIAIILCTLSLGVAFVVWRTTRPTAGAGAAGPAEPSADSSAPPTLGRSSVPAELVAEARRPMLLREVNERAAARPIAGSVSWLGDEDIPNASIDGVLVLALDDGGRRSLSVIDAGWRTELPPKARAKLVAGELAGRRLEPWANSVEIDDGAVLDVRPCSARTLVVRTPAGKSAQRVRVARSSELAGPASHPGPSAAFVTLAEGLASPISLETAWLGGAALWIGADDCAWQRLTVDAASPPTLEVELEPGAAATVRFRGQRTEQSLVLAAREVDRNVALFEWPQPTNEPIELEGLPCRGIELALLRPSLGWTRVVSSTVIDLGQERHANATLDWPAPMAPHEQATVACRISFDDPDLPAALIAELKLELTPISDDGVESPRPANSIPFSLMQLTRQSPPEWTFESQGIAVGAYVASVRPLGHRQELSVRPGSNGLEVHVGVLARMLLDVETNEPDPAAVPLPRIICDDPTGRANAKAYVERDGSGRFIVVSAPGPITVFAGRSDRWPTIQHFDSKAGWNRDTLRSFRAYELSLHARSEAAPRSLPTTWWNELKLTPPNATARVLFVRYSNPSEAGAESIKVGLSACGDWHVEGVAPNGVAFDKVAHVRPDGANEIFLSRGELAREGRLEQRASERSRDPREPGSTRESPQSPKEDYP